MSELGQKAKYSLRAHMVCFAPDSGLKSDIALCPKRAMNGLVGSIILAPLDVTAYTKKKGRLRCHKRPKSREETPKEGSDSELGLDGFATA
jgi:hypothetical protein